MINFFLGIWEAIRQLAGVIYLVVFVVASAPSFALVTMFAYGLSLNKEEAKCTLNALGLIYANCLYSARSLHNTITPWGV